ncbi:MAG: right-handed parallel beta-helix repeat-containing protein [Planctomycetota bacterium]
MKDSPIVREAIKIIKGYNEELGKVTEGIVNGGGVTGEELEKGKVGKTVPFSPAAPTDTSWRSKKVIVDSTKVNLGKNFEKDPEFIALLDVFVHEAVHLGQIISTGRIEPEGNVRKRRVENERGAYSEDKKFKEELKRTLETIRNNITHGLDPKTGVPESYQIFCGCTVGELDKLIEKCKDDIKCKKETLDILNKYPNVDMDKDGKTGTPEDLAAVEKWLTGNQIILEGSTPMIALYLSSERPQIKQYNPATEQEVDLDTRIPYPLAMEVLTDIQGHKVLLIGGIDGVINPSGIIRGFWDLDSDGFFDEASAVTFVEGVPSLKSASNFTTDANGNLLVYDSESCALYPLADTNDDLIPDTLVTTSVIPFNPVVFEHIAEIKRFGDYLIGYQRFIVPLSGDAEVVYVQDQDDDGFYETIRRLKPSDFPFLYPSFYSEPFTGKVSLSVLAAKNHRVEVWKVDSTGQTISLLGEATTGSNNMAVVELAEALGTNWYLKVIDRDVYLESVVRRTEAPYPVVYNYSECFDTPAGGARIVAFGDCLQSINRVTFGETDAAVVSKSDTSIVLTTPAFQQEGYCYVKFYYDNLFTYGPNFFSSSVVPPSGEIIVSPTGNDQTGDGSWYNPYRTIQTAINATSVGHTVIVRDGIYTGFGNRDLDFGGKAITVRSENGPANCVIDCEGAVSRGFYFHSGETANSVVARFTIRNGNRDTYYGGGIFCEDASPMIMGCVIRGNIAAWGGGIFCRRSSAVIVNCILTENTGVYDSGGFWCSDNCDITISNCLIACNTGYAGGGIGCTQNSKLTVTNCTISGNTASQVGGGIYCWSSDVVVNNGIIWGNSAGLRGNQIRVNVPGGTVTLNYCDFANGTNDISVGGTGSVTPVSSINLDPLFVNAMSGNYHLQAISPCIDRGNNNYASGISTDLDGNPRLADGNSPPDGTATIDIGAYELNSPGGSDVIVYLPFGVTATFSQITGAGSTTLTVSEDPPIPPYGFEALGDVYDISTTAIYSGTITLSIPYSQVVGEEFLRLWQYDSGAEEWVKVPTQWTDAISNIIHAHVDHLTLFAIFRDNRPPEISVTVAPNYLWPPNHKMVDITATVIVSDNCDPQPTVMLTSVISNESDNANGAGDGNTVNDIQGAKIGVADYNFSLRAERAGSGSGRIYTIIYTATDAFGNNASATAIVRVPHDASEKELSLGEEYSPQTGRGGCSLDADFTGGSADTIGYFVPLMLFFGTVVGLRLGRRGITQ